MSQPERFTVLRAVDRVWAIGAVHGESEKLAQIHDAIAGDIQFGDRIVYLGNYFGYGPDAVGVLEELLRFRSWYLSHPPYRDADDIVYLRGAQEEMWWKLLQLQFAPNPGEILTWMADRGVDSILSSIGFRLEDGMRLAQEGTLAMTHWTTRLRETARALPGHDSLIGALKRAAYTENGALLFVHAGVDIDKPLARQADSFWWASRSFTSITRPYRGFRRIVRGFDPDMAGIVETPYTLSIDGGAGRGGTLNAVLLSDEGDIEHRLSV